MYGGILAISDDSGFHLSATLQGCNDYGLAASALHALFAGKTLPFALVHVTSLAADVSLVNFYWPARPAKFPSGLLILQCLPDALKHEPCRFLCDSERTRNLVAAHTVSAVDQHPCCSHPFVESERGIFKDGSDFESELLFAAVAEPHAARLDE